MSIHTFLHIIIRSPISSFVITFPLYQLPQMLQKLSFLRAGCIYFFLLPTDCHLTELIIAVVADQTITVISHVKMDKRKKRILT